MPVSGALEGALRHELEGLLVRRTVGGGRPGGVRDGIVEDEAAPGADGGEDDGMEDGTKVVPCGGGRRG